ncbi:unnamed protein product [Ophioblennius macclurei]
MPQSDTWPGGTGMEPMHSMGSAGSCDSVVSANSASSDDSLDYLSAEEKACLMFLEETIDSLDTEEDSGLSNDEPDLLPPSGSLTAKLADLSASMSKTKINGLDKHSKKTSQDNAETKILHSYLVPTPFAVANSAPSSASSAKSFPSLPVASKSGTSDHKENRKSVRSPVPPEVQAAVPPSTKPQEYFSRTGDAALARGPLSYEALVHLRKNASAKKTPLCPTVDHTIELDKAAPTPVALNLTNLPRATKLHKEVPKSQASAPSVVSKPQSTPVNVPTKAQNESASTESSNSVKHANDSKVVRQEALQKLGLLRDEEPENDAVAPLSEYNSHSSFNPMPKRFTIRPSTSSASRSPSFCYSQVTAEPKNRHLQNSASFHHSSRHDEQPVSSKRPTQSNGLRKSAVEHSSTMDDRRSSPEQQHMTHAKPVKNPYYSAPPTAPKPSKSKAASQNPANVVGYTSMVVPGVGTDRTEALRKLGLLKK